MAGFDHTRMEKDLIERFGGEPRTGYGIDGTLADGSPVEVRTAKRDDRFRLGEDVHEDLLEQGGSYIFDKIGDGKPPKRVPAERVDHLLPQGDWFKDRSYDHKFLDVDDIF